MENLTLNIRQEIHVRASLDVTFAALLEHPASLPPGAVDRKDQTAAPTGIEQNTARR